MDEFYAYDGMSQLVNFDRGDLNGGKTAIETLASEETYTFDATGNWTAFTTGIGASELNQARTHNTANEMTDITESTGAEWTTPVHDAVGNATAVPWPIDPEVEATCVYDAWNRLFRVETDDPEACFTYRYDGLNRRIGFQWVHDTYYEATRHYYFNDSWQTLETRYTESWGDEPEEYQPEWQYVNSARYIDAPVLRDENTDDDWLCDDERLERIQEKGVAKALAQHARLSHQSTSR